MRTCSGSSGEPPPAALTARRHLARASSPESSGEMPQAWRTASAKGHHMLASP